MAKVHEYSKKYSTRQLCGCSEVLKEDVKAIFLKWLSSSPSSCQIHLQPLFLANMKCSCPGPPYTLTLEILVYRSILWHARIRSTFKPSSTNSALLPLHTFLHTHTCASQKDTLCTCVILLLLDWALHGARGTVSKS